MRSKRREGEGRGGEGRGGEGRIGALTISLVLRHPRPPGGESGSLIRISCFQHLSHLEFEMANQIAESVTKRT